MPLADLGTITGRVIDILGRQQMGMGPLTGIINLRFVNPINSSFVEPIINQATQGNFFKQNISGTVTDDSTPVARLVRLYHRETGNLLAETTSSAIDGSFVFSNFNVPPNIEFFIIAFDDDGGVDKNAEILDKIVGA